MSVSVLSWLSVGVLMYSRTPVPYVVLCGVCMWCVSRIPVPYVVLCGVCVYVVYEQDSCSLCGVVWCMSGV